MTWPPAFIVVGLFLAGATSRATSAPPSFCEKRPNHCHHLTEGEQQYFIGLWQQARRAVVVPPGFRCTQDAGPDFDRAGYGTKPGRVVPEEVMSMFGCYRGPLEPRRLADVLVGVRLSPLPVVLRDSKDALERRLAC